jgi:hypothetical protein
MTKTNNLSSRCYYGCSKCNNCIHNVSKYTGGKITLDCDLGKYYESKFDSFKDKIKRFFNGGKK